MKLSKKDLTKKDLGKRLRGLRNYYGWSTREIHVFLPELKNLLLVYERGKQEVPAEVLEQLALLYDFEAAKLLDPDIPIPVSPPVKKREGLLNSINQMLERAEVTGRYNLLFRNYSVIRIYHNPQNADEILLLRRDHEGDTHNSIPLEKFRCWDAKRIEQEISYLHCQPSRKYLLHIPSIPYERDVLKMKIRMVVIHPLPKGCEEYEPFWHTIPELDIVSCNSVKEGLHLIQECRPDAVVFHPSNARKGEAFLRELRDVLHVSVRCMPHVFFLCRDGERYYVQREGGHLLRAAKLPSAAWFAKYALLDLHIQEGCFSYTAPLSLEEIKAGIHKGLIKHRIHAELEEPFEAAAVYALTFFQHMELVGDAFEAAAKELGWEQGVFWMEVHPKKLTYLSAREAACDVLRDMWAVPYTIRKSTVPCSPIAKALASAEWHKHLRIAGSPIQIGGEAWDDE